MGRAGMGSDKVKGVRLVAVRWLCVRWVEVRWVGGVPLITYAFLPDF